jgi:hypothetical protein
MSSNRANGTPASSSWRSTLPIHPAAELFPRMSPDELRALGEDIVKTGLKSPIVLWRRDSKSQPSLLDGISRLDAIEIATGSPVTVGAPSIMAGEHFLACDTVIVLDKSVDPYGYVISVNLHRRHLTAEQKRELIAQLLKATPEKSDRQIAETVKASPTTVGTVRAEMSTIQIGQLPKRVGKDGKARKQPMNKPRTTVPKVGASPATASNSNNAGHDVGPDSTSEAAGLRARNQELEHEKHHLENASLALISEGEEAAAARSKDNGSRAESAPSRGLIWKGDDENGWLTKIENRYYSVTRYMGQGTGRGKNKNPGHFIYTACCLDIRRLEENPKLISQYGERIEPSNLPDPNSIYAGLGRTAPKIARTADEAKGLCEEVERRNHLPAAIETRSANDAAPRTADDGLDIPEFLRRTAP